MLHFYILDDLNKQPFTGVSGNDSKTSNYTKVNAKVRNERDTLSGRKYKYLRYYDVDWKDTGNLESHKNKDKTRQGKVKTVLKNGDLKVKKILKVSAVSNHAGLTGKKTWKELADHMCSLKIKMGQSDIDVYLIYQKAGRGHVMVTKRYFDHNDEENKYKRISSKAPIDFGEIPGSSGSGSFSVADAKNRNKDNEPVPKSSKNSGVYYFAKNVSMKYTDKNGDKKEVKVKVDNHLTAGQNSAIWSGKETLM